MLYRLQLSKSLIISQSGILEFLFTLRGSATIVVSTKKFIRKDGITIVFLNVTKKLGIKFIQTEEMRVFNVLIF